MKCGSKTQQGSKFCKMWQKVGHYEFNLNVRHVFYFIQQLDCELNSNYNCQMNVAYSKVH